MEGPTQKRRRKISPVQPIKRQRQDESLSENQKRGLQAVVKPQRRRDESLSENQERALRAVVEERRNVFITGKAGTGKTYLIHKIVEDFPGIVAVTATTGVAATHIDGCTLHSFAGMSPWSVKHPKSHLKKIRNNRGAVKRFRDTDLLIIDEVPMMSPDQFKLLDQQARALRGRHSESFGGLQLVLSGDFFQLPPVPDREPGKLEMPAVYCFETEAWENAEIECIKLVHCFRQSGDRIFEAILDDIRLGRCTQDAERTIQSCQASFEHEPINLVSRNDRAARINADRLNQLEGTTYSYRAKDSFHKMTRCLADYETPEQAIMASVSLLKPVPRVLRSCLYPETLELKEGARVMLLRNMEVDGVRLCNGSMGTIDSLEASTVYVRFDRTTGDVVPILARNWVYTWTEDLARSWRYRMAVRHQIPLRLAWAISIHKSQGMTLEKARVDLRQVFEKHQVYVALSRVRSLGGLAVQGFRRGSIRVDPKVLAFYRGLEAPKPCVTCGQDMTSLAPNDAVCAVCLQLYDQI